MTAAPRPSWLVHLALACAAMVCVLLAGAPMASRRLPTMQHTATNLGSGRFRIESAQRVLAMNHAAPIDRASARLAPTARAAWQRSGGRRGQRTASSQIPGVERTGDSLARSSYDRHRSTPTVARVSAQRRDGRLGSAPTRAPPIHR
ncbi:hypothetical protein [Gemmatimonas sp.]|uniref:hypothetical protein n=1 Tax=Gemmatimonas sp. TaxID=1962908 RepID=UPI00286C162C|nr:hypothetical protein [Gemmatimonas sp.]